MALVIGLVLIGAGIFHYQRSRRPPAAVVTAGTVVVIKSERSKISGRSTMQYGAVISYQDPMSGVQKTLEPTHWTKEGVYNVGDSVELVSVAATGVMRVVHPKPWTGLVVLGLMGAVLIAIQIASWV